MRGSSLLLFVVLSGCSTWSGDPPRGLDDGPGTPPKSFGGGSAGSPSKSDGDNDDEPLGGQPSAGSGGASAIASTPEPMEPSGGKGNWGPVPQGGGGAGGAGDQQPTEPDDDEDDPPTPLGGSGGNRPVGGSAGQGGVGGISMGGVGGSGGSRPVGKTGTLTINCRHDDQLPSEFSNELGAYAGTPYFDVFNHADGSPIAKNLPCGSSIPDLSVVGVYQVYGYESGVPEVRVSQLTFTGTYNILMPDTCRVDGIECGSLYVNCGGDELTQMNYSVKYKTGPHAGELLIEHMPCDMKPVQPVTMPDRRYVYTILAYQADKFQFTVGGDFDFTVWPTFTTRLYFPFAYKPDEPAAP